MTSWQVPYVAAFQINFFSSRHRCPHTDTARQHQHQVRRWATSSTNHTPNRNIKLDDNSFDIYAMEGDRRSFLKNFSYMMTGIISTEMLLAPPTPALASSTVDDVNETLEKVDRLIKDEIELNDTVIQEEQDEKTSIEDEKKLINELEKEIQIEANPSSTPNEVTEEAQRIQGGTEALIKEEEKLKSETENMILKIEAMESDVDSLDANAKSGGEKKASDAFVEKLKERVEQKEDLITKLKRQSERDIDPKTGKFKTMSPSEYKDRVKSTDVDFLQFLKDTVANEQELQNDLDAFQGLLERKFGPVVRELRKDLTPIVGEVQKDMGPLVGEMENQIRKEVAPAVLDGMEQLKDKAKLAVDGDVEELKQRAGDLIGKLRSLF